MGAESWLENEVSWEKLVSLNSHTRPVRRASEIQEPFGHSLFEKS